LCPLRGQQESDGILSNRQSKESHLASRQVTLTSINKSGNDQNDYACQYLLSWLRNEHEKVRRSAQKSVTRVFATLSVRRTPAANPGDEASRMLVSSGNHSTFTDSWRLQQPINLTSFRAM